MYPALTKFVCLVCLHEYHMVRIEIEAEWTRHLLKLWNLLKHPERQFCFASYILRKCLLIRSALRGNKKKKEPGGPTDLARNLHRFLSWTQAPMGIFPTPSTVDFEWRLGKKSLAPRAYACCHAEERVGRHFVTFIVVNVHLVVV